MLWTTLLLVRHGHTRDNTVDDGARLSGWYDAPLSARGEREAQLLANWVRSQGVAAVYTSTLIRARDTAAPMAAALGLHAAPEPGLREISCGRLEGLSLARVQHEFPDLWQRNLRQTDEEFRWPGGESYRDLRQRALACLALIAARHRGQRVLLVTHAGVISQVLGALHGTSAARWELWRPRNGSVTEVCWHDDGGVLVYFDRQPSLAPDQVGSAQHA
ncbi:MAG: histidine phosphatase family protein [Chloroflexota bacterium]|nr:histidine phosphatase family protein [Chloroflexota bacterium]